MLTVGAERPRPLIVVGVEDWGDPAYAVVLQSMLAGDSDPSINDIEPAKVWPIVADVVAAWAEDDATLVEYAADLRGPVDHAHQNQHLCSP